jgi:sec-independent protein translocase protein TatA
VSIGPFQILIIALVLLVLFGRGRISDLMGDFGKGVTSFRKGLADDPPNPAPSLDGVPLEAKAEPARERSAG